jgi:hypothetical protein
LLPRLTRVRRGGEFFGCCSASSADSELESFSFSFSCSLIVICSATQQIQSIDVKEKIIGSFSLKEELYFENAVGRQTLRNNGSLFFNSIRFCVLVTTNAHSLLVLSRMDAQIFDRLRTLNAIGQGILIQIYNIKQLLTNPSRANYVFDPNFVRVNKALLVKFPELPPLEKVKSVKIQFIFFSRVYMIRFLSLI